MIDGFAITLDSCLHNQFLHIDVGAVEPCELGRIVRNRCGLDAVAINQTGYFDTTPIGQAGNQAAIGDVAVDPGRNVGFDGFDDV